MANDRGWQISGKLSDGRYVKASDEETNMIKAAALLLRKVYAQMPAGMQLVRFSMSARRVRGASKGVAIRATPIND